VPLLFFSQLSPTLQPVPNTSALQSMQIFVDILCNMLISCSCSENLHQCFSMVNFLCNPSMMHMLKKASAHPGTEHHQLLLFFLVLQHFLKSVMEGEENEGKLATELVPRRKTKSLPAPKTTTISTRHNPSEHVG
jgi:hypothetical protein